MDDSTKTIRLLALDFYAVIVDSGFALHIYSCQHIFVMGFIK